MDKIDLETFDQAYVLSLDILGFSKIVKNNSHQHLVNLFEDYTNTYNVDLDLVNKHYLRTFFSDSSGVLKSLFISDTLIIYSLNAEIENFIKMVALAQVIITNSFELGVPLRGCLTSGALTIKHLENNDIIFGRAIVDAYEYEKIQEWAGCCITQQCLETVERFHINKDIPCLEWLLKRKDIVKYMVPLKNDKYEDMHTINWKNTANQIRLSESTIRTAFLQHKKGPVDEQEYQKIKAMRNNTLEFWNSDIT